MVTGRSRLMLSFSRAWTSGWMLMLWKARRSLSTSRSGVLLKFMFTGAVSRCSISRSLSLLRLAVTLISAERVLSRSVYFGLNCSGLSGSYGGPSLSASMPA